MPKILLLGEFQEKLSERFRGLSGIFPESLPESPSRLGGMAHLCLLSVIVMFLAGELRNPCGGLLDNVSGARSRRV